jgi:DNA-binding GntR family transcriptional regulator
MKQQFYAKLAIMDTKITLLSTKTQVRERVASRIVEAVEKDILAGQLRPGDRLDELTLAERFEVSRTPVREALLELTARGLAGQQARRGTFVTDVTLAEVLGTYEVLAQLEGLCARLATRRMSAPQKAELEALHQRMAAYLDASGRTQYIELDATFHSILVAGAHNPSLGEHIDLCLKKVAPVRLGSMHSVRDMAAAHAEHGELLHAMLEGDDAKAESLMRTHVTLRADQVRDVMAVWDSRRQHITGAKAARKRPVARTD